MNKRLMVISLIIIVALSLFTTVYGAMSLAEGPPAPTSDSSHTRSGEVTNNPPARFSGLAETPVYIRSEAGGPPWNASTNEAAMDRVFGSGQWDDLRYESVDINQLLSPRPLIFMEGGDNNADEMEAFLTANISQIEQWVDRGGCLLLNAAPNEGDGMSFGFGGVTLNYEDSSGAVTAVDSAHPVFNGPFLPVGISFSGSSFSHASVSGGGVTYILTDNALAEKDWGFGHVLFGGMTTDNFHDPQPEAANLRANIIDYTYCERDLIVAQKDSSDPVLPSDTVTYTVRIANNTLLTVATGVVLTDVLPMDSSYVGATPTQGSCTLMGGEVSCNIGTVMTRTAVTVEVTLIAPASEGLITNTAHVASNEFPLQSDEETTLVALFTDVSIDKSDSADPVALNEVFTYTVTIANNGPSVANGLVITDKLPNGVTEIVALPDQGSCVVNEGYRLYGIEGAPFNGGGLHIIDQQTGAASLIGYTGLFQSSALDFASDGTLYATGSMEVVEPLQRGGDLGSAFLYVVDEATAVANQVGAGATGAAVVPGMSIAPDDTLYAYSREQGSSNHEIGTIDLTTAEYISIGVPNLSDIGGNGLAYNPADNMLYHASEYLSIIDPATANVVMTRPLNYPILFNQLGISVLVFNGLDFDPGSGQLYGSLQESIVSPVRDVAGGPPPLRYLATIDISTGDVSLVGEIDFEISGLAFDSQLSPLSVTCNLSTLGVGETHTIHLQMRAPASETTLVNHALVTAAEYDDNGANNEAFEETVVTAVADLSLSKTDNPDPVLAGQPLTYTLVVTNHGPQTATNVIIADELPFEVGYVSATTPQGSCGLGSTTLYALVEHTGNVPFYEINAFTGQATLIGSTGLDRSSALDVASDGTVYATGTPFEGGPLREVLNHENPYLYTIDPTTAVTTQVGITRTGAEVIPGMSFSPDDTLYAYNNGPDELGTIDITTAEYISISVLGLNDPIGNGLAYSPVDDLIYHAGEYLTVIDPNTGAVIMTKTLNYPETPTGEPRFNALDFDPISGQLFGSLYEFDAIFGGPLLGGGGSASVHIAIIDVATGDVAILAQTVDDVSAIAFKPQTADTLACSIDELAQGESATITVVVTAPFSQTIITNTATVSSSEYDPDESNNTAVATTQVLLATDLAIEKTAAAEVMLEQTLVYSLTVSNQGAMTATDVLVTDDLPAGLTFVSATPGAPACTESGGTVTCDLAELAPGDSATITIVTTINTNAPATLSNTATVSSSVADNDTNNNTATAVTAVTDSTMPAGLLFFPVVFKNG